MTGHHHIHSVAFAGILETRFRRLLHNPRAILFPLVQAGMTVLDVGCGPGFFSIPAASLVGKTGRVIAVDIQEGMLSRLKRNIRNSPIESIITVHQSSENSLGMNVPVDFAIAFYTVHELSNPSAYFTEIAQCLRPRGHFLVVEPLLHVSGREFNATVALALKTGFKEVSRQKIWLSKSVLLRKDG